MYLFTGRPTVDKNAFLELVKIYVYQHIIQITELLTLVLLDPDTPCLCKQSRSRSVEEANWPGSAVFAIKHANLYPQSESNNLIGWKLGVAS